jgi:heptaprenyl diphosphate synthase
VTGNNAESTGLMGRLSLKQRLFASPETKHLAATIDAGIEQIESALGQEMHFGDALADVPARYLLDAGGKRVRPMLALLIAQLGNGATPEVIIAAEAIELTHLASLYHDDVMDVAPLRRGVPTAHEVWGNSVAILTGDLLFSRASTLMTRLGERAMLLQSETFERLCLGQLHETLGPRPGEDPVDHYIQVLADKTGSLISAAARCGIVYSGAPAELEPAVVEFGDKIGVAFQLADDVIDLAPATDATGKKAGTDLRAGVPTLPTLLLQRAAATDASSAALWARIQSGVHDVQSPDPLVAEAADADLDLAITALFAHEVTEATRQEARRWADEAVAALAPLPAGPVKTALLAFSDHVVSRTS